MVAIPAYCPNGHIFEFNSLITVEGGAKIERLTLANNVVPCPVCGAPSKLVDGEFGLEKEVLTFLSGPAITPTIIAALKRVAEDAASKAISSEQAVVAAEQIAPGAGRYFDIKEWPPQAKATIYGALIGAIALVSAASITTFGHGVGGQTTIENAATPTPPPPPSKHR